MNEDQGIDDLPPIGSVGYYSLGEGQGLDDNFAGQSSSGQPSNLGQSRYGMHQAPFAAIAPRTGPHSGLGFERTVHAKPAPGSGNIRPPEPMSAASSQTASADKTHRTRGTACGRCKSRKQRCTPGLNTITCSPCEAARTDCTGPDVYESTARRKTRLPRGENCDQCWTRKRKCTPGLNTITCLPCGAAGSVCTNDRNTGKSQGTRSRRIGEESPRASGSQPADAASNQQDDARDRSLDAFTDRTVPSENIVEGFVGDDSSHAGDWRPGTPGPSGYPEDPLDMFLEKII